MDKILTRSAVAKQLDIHPETLRYYEQQHLIDKPARVANDYRVYNQSHIQQLRFILTAKRLGFSLKEIKELMALAVTKKSNRKKVRAMAQTKSTMIDEKISQLTQLKSALDQLIVLCRKSKGATRCPILACLQR